MINERRIDGTSLRIECDVAVAQAAEDVLETFARLAAAGSTLRAGLRLRFGWSVLTLQAEPDGALRVCEPDFDTDPRRQTRPNVDITLSVISAQVSLARRLNVKPVDVYFEQMLIAAPGALDGHELSLQRSAQASTDDSGWFLANPQRLAPTPENELEALPVYQLLHSWPTALVVLVLPVGFTALVDHTGVSAVWDEEGHEQLGTPPA